MVVMEAFVFGFWVAGQESSLACKPRLLRKALANIVRYNAG
jgi:hypothetical protein